MNYFLRDIELKHKKMLHFSYQSSELLLRATRHIIKRVNAIFFSFMFDVLYFMLFASKHYFPCAYFSEKNYTRHRFVWLLFTHRQVLKHGAYKIEFS